MKKISLQKFRCGYSIAAIPLLCAFLAFPPVVMQGCLGSPAGPNTEPIPGGGRWLSFARAPVPFHESAAAVIDGKLYYVGGRLENGPINSLYRYDPPPVDAWTQLASHPGTQVDHMGAAVVDGILYAIGGTIEFPGPSVSEVYAYNPATNQWTAKASMPAPLGIMGVGVVNGKIYCLGGLSNYQATNFVFEYDPATDQWTDLTLVCPMPTARDHCVAAALNGKIHMIGGRQTDVFSILNVHEAFDPASRSWETMASLPTARAGFSAAVLLGKILIMGGEGAANPTGVFAENEEYNPATNTWRTLSPMITPRHSTQAGVIDDVVYVAAGAPQIYRTFTDINEGFSFKFE
ncbi:MAG: galactose oxidase [Planctomycetota bacterium]|nr:MAG: galactose oxidase [Planctomycetota bacterium]